MPSSNCTQTWYFLCVFIANLNFLMSVQLTGSCLPLGCSAAGVKTGNPGPAASTFALTGPLGSRRCCESFHPSSCLTPAACPRHGCGLPWLTLVAAGRPVGSSMGTRQKMISSPTPWSRPRRLEGAVFPILWPLQAGAAAPVKPPSLSL